MTFKGRGFEQYLDYSLNEHPRNNVNKNYYTAYPPTAPGNTTKRPFLFSQDLVDLKQLIDLVHTADQELSNREWNALFDANQPGRREFK